MKIRLRRLWLNIHGWLGLSVGLLFVLLGLTGSLLVFDHAIDEWLNPQLLLTEGSGTRRPLVEVVAAAERAVGGDTTHAHSLQAPRVERGVWTAWFPTGSETAPQWTLVYVDPYTARVTGQRVWGYDLMSWIYKLHYTLHGGNVVGCTIVGIAGLLMMISAATGIYLWWPLWRSGWRAAFAVRRGARLNYDLHKTLGVVSSVALLVIAFTGVYMEFPNYVKPLVTVFSEETLPPEGLQSTPDSAASLSPEEAIAIALEQFPDATFDHFHPPEGPRGVYEIGMRQPGEVTRSFGRTQVWIDPYSGAVLAVRDPRQATFADSFIAWQYPLHNGEAFGLVGRWIVFFVGLAPAILYVTGLLVWWRKRRSRRRQRDHAVDLGGTVADFAAPARPRAAAEPVAVPVAGGE